MQPIKNVLYRFTAIKSNMVPQQCSCSLDSMLSADHQKKITESIQQLHQVSKNPHEIITKIVQDFPEIKDMQAEICSADKICFNAQAVQPVFLLNDDLVVSDVYTTFKQESLDIKTLNLLPKIYSQENDQCKDMALFIRQLPHEIAKSYKMSWSDKDHIFFKHQKHANMVCLVSDSLIPSVDIFENCCELYDEFLKKSFKKNNKTMVQYDIRFKDQIIVKSGGKYG